MSDYKNTMSKTGFAYFIILGCSTLFQVCATAALTYLNVNYAEMPLLLIVLTGLPIYAMALIAYPIFIRRLPRVHAKQRRTIKPLHLIALIAFCIGLMYLANIVSSLLSAFITAIKGNSVINPIQQMYGNGLLFNVVYTCLLAPFCEELIFRKMMWHAVGRYGERVFVITSAVMFGLFHGNLQQLLYTMLLGAVWATVYARTGRIIYSIILHICVNLAGTVIIPSLIVGSDSRILFVLGYALMFGFMLFAGVMLALHSGKFKLENDGEALPEHAAYYEYSSLGMVLYFALSAAIIILMTVA